MVFGSGSKRQIFTIRPRAALVYFERAAFSALPHQAS
jgi:hypothetical protein